MVSSASSANIIIIKKKKDFKTTFNIYIKSLNRKKIKKKQIEK